MWRRGAAATELGVSTKLSPVHTSDNVAKNGDIVAETGNMVFLATMLPVISATLSPVSATMSRFLATMSPFLATLSLVWTGLYTVRRARVVRGWASMTLSYVTSHPGQLSLLPLADGKSVPAEGL